MPLSLIIYVYIPIYICMCVYIYNIHLKVKAGSLGTPRPVANLRPQPGRAGGAFFDPGQPRKGLRCTKTCEASSGTRFRGFRGLGLVYGCTDNAKLPRAFRVEGLGV